MKKFIILTLLLFLLSACSPSTPTWDIPVSFYNPDEMMSEGLYFLHSDESEPTLVLDLPETRTYNRPAFSPDGRYLAFIRNNGFHENSGTYLLDLAATNAQPVRVTEFGSHSLFWSPDGRKLLLYDYGDGMNDQADYFGIYDLDSADLEIHSIPEKRSDDWSFDWSPDGTKITFITYYTADQKALYVFDLQSKLWTALIIFAENDYVYSPHYGTDNRIYFSYANSSSTGWEIRSIDPDTSTITAISQVNGWIFEEVLSPDRHYLAFIEQIEPSPASFARQKFWATLSSRNPIENRALEEFLFDQFLNSSPRRRSSIVVLDLGTGQKYRLSDFSVLPDTVGYRTIYWSPDSSEIAVVMHHRDYTADSTTVTYPIP